MKVTTTPTMQVSAKTLTAALIIFSYSCGKYDDGPALSLRSKNARLTGDWESTDVNVSGLSNLDLEIELDIAKDGDFDMKLTTKYNYYGQTYSYSYTYTGEWSWEDGKETVELDFDEPDRPDWDLEIKRLTNKELHAEWEIYEYDVETEFEKQ